MTAHAMRGDREKCLAAGMDGYIAKPLDPKVFLETVEAAGRGGVSAPGSERQQAAAEFSPVALLDRFSGNRKLVGSLIRTFRADSPKMIRRIREALTSREADRVADAAHALKGSVGNFGPSRAFDTAREIEMAARGGTLDGSWKMYRGPGGRNREFAVRAGNYGRRAAEEPTRTTRRTVSPEGGDNDAHPGRR